MSQRLYALITRSAALLILALLVAPIWDSWRYRGLPPSGGAAFPVGAIMPAPPREPEARASQVVTAGGQPVPPGSRAETERLAALQSSIPAWAPPSTETQPPAFRSMGSGFEAWAARAQVDPFWNGDTAAGSPDSPQPGEPPTTGGLAADALDEAEQTEAGPQDPSATAGGIRPTRAPALEQRRAGAEDTDPEESDSAQPPSQADDATPPGESGVLTGLWPIVPAESAAAPEPVPDPFDSGSANLSRVHPPRPAPRDPQPAPVVVPLVTALVAASEVAPGETFLVAIRIEGADQVTSLPFHLIFDSAVIEFAGSQAGSALATHDPILLASVSPNRPGDLAVGLSLIESAGTFTGNGEVVNLQFRALVPGQTDLSFSRATLRGSRSEPLEARFAGASVTVR